MPKSRFDEIAVRTRPCRVCFRRSREFEQFRPDIRAYPEDLCDSSCWESNRPTSGTDQKDRRAKCKDRHAFAANSQAPVAAVQPTPWRYNWRGRTFNFHIGNIDIHRRTSRIIREGWRWQQPRRCPWRDAHLHREDAQHQRKRTPKIQSHR